jgi:hypothetical protein
MSYPFFFLYKLLTPSIISLSNDFLFFILLTSPSLAFNFATKSCIPLGIKKQFRADPSYKQQVRALGLTKNQFFLKSIKPPNNFIYVIYWPRVQKYQNNLAAQLARVKRLLQGGFRLESHL